jgi:hypothetical protein
MKIHVIMQYEIGLQIHYVFMEYVLDHVSLAKVHVHANLFHDY